MLTDFWTSFLLFRHEAGADGMGGAAGRLAPGGYIQAQVTGAAGKERCTGGIPAVHAGPMLLHRRDLRLLQDDVVQRISDGARFRVAGDSIDMQTPVIAECAYAQVPVERLVDT